MTVGQETTSAEAVSTGSELEAAPALASWPARAGAFALDVVLGVAIIAVMALLGYAARADGTLWVYAAVATVAAAAVLVNRWLLPSITGWSLGRSLFSIRVVRVPAGAPAGMGRLILRDVAHLVDTVAVFLGWLLAGEALTEARRYTQPYTSAHLAVRAGKLGSRASLLGGLATAVQLAADRPK